MSSAPGIFHWFQSGNSWCASVWHQGRADPATVAILCPSWSVEQLRGRRDFRELAQRLSRLGVASLRIDYPGTANSASGASDNLGSDADGAEVRWANAVVDAVAHARGLAPRARIVLVGRRLGALIAACASAHVEEHVLASVVLWDPPESGAAFFRELKLREATRTGQTVGVPAAERSLPASSQPGIEVDGFQLAGDDVASLAALKLGDFAHLAHVTVIAPNTRLQDRLGARLKAEGVQFAFRFDCIADASYDLALFEGDAFTSEVTIATIARIIATVDAERPRVVHAKSGEGLGVDSMTRVISTSAGNGESQLASVRERVVHGGDDDAIFGLLSEREGQPTNMPTETAVLLVGTGTDHLAGQGDLSVRWARRVAAMGTPVLRIDFRGIGDSPARSGQAENMAYQIDRERDIREMAELLRGETGAVSLVVFGICTGAFFGIRATSGNPLINRVIAVNPQLYWDGSTPPDWSATALHEIAERAMGAAADVAKWRKLLRGAYQARDILAALRGLASRAADRLSVTTKARGPIGAGLARLDFDVVFPLSSHFDLVFSREDSGYRHLMAHGPRALRELKKRGNVRVHVLENANHTFSTRAMRQRLDEFVIRLIAERA